MPYDGREIGKAEGDGMQEQAKPAFEAEARLVADCRNRLGECCFEDPRDGNLWWTDIEGSCVWRMDRDGNTARFMLPGRAGFILPRREPGFVIGFPKQLALADQSLSSFTRLHDVEPDLPQTRINDAEVDPFGGIVFGTFDETPQMEDRRPVASVYRLGPDGSLKRLFGDVIISNGLAFSPAGDIMYFADTPDGRIRRFRLGADFASLDEIEPLAGRDDAPGLPDGGTVDADGSYWSARVWGGCAVRFDDRGRITARIDLPTKAPTCVTLGGAGRRRLFITTLSTRHSAEELTDVPFAGGVFAADIDRPGLEQRLCTL
ncbi:MAG: SMP-30/gluconolactonase/LRE family protein [Alphaproteobacteria bacterium]|nr:MAG: SMP-30/gluconolactonase/LRE family protein [Alphaproteobacteria bacterium]